MLRVLAPRRGVLAAAAAAVAVTVHETNRDKLPVYPAPESVIVLQETPSELEKQIGTARRALTATFEDAHARVQGVVSKWIGVEHAVESRVKSLIAPEEPLTPGLLYVGVAGLTGSVVARNRMIFWRVLLPPTLVVLSMQHFLPRTSHNVSAYFGELEDTYFPTLAQKHAVASAHTAMTIEMAKDAAQNGRERTTEAIIHALGWVEGATGLKLRESIGWGQEAVKQVERQIKTASAYVEQKAGSVTEVVEQKAEEVKASVEQKTEEAKAPVEPKVEEVKRLV